MKIKKQQPCCNVIKWVGCSSILLFTQDHMDPISLFDNVQT